MKFILLIRGEDKFRQLSPTEAQVVLEKYFAWSRKLRETGRYLDGEGLVDGGVMLSSDNGMVTDGPLPETKDIVGGYFTFTADSMEEAVEICRECPSLSYGGAAEIRAIAVYE